MRRALAGLLAMACVSAGIGNQSVAGLITTPFGGEITFADPNNPFGVVLGDPVSGQATYEADLIAPVDFSEVAIDSDPSFALQFTVGSHTFFEFQDTDFGEGFPLVTFQDGQFSGLDFFVFGFTEGSFDNLDLVAVNNTFEIVDIDSGDTLVEGRVFATSATAVPEPSSFALLALGGFAVLVYRRRTISGSGFAAIG